MVLLSTEKCNFFVTLPASDNCNETPDPQNASRLHVPKSDCLKGEQMVNKVPSGLRIKLVGIFQQVEIASC